MSGGSTITVVFPAGAHASKGESQWSLRPRAGGTSGEAGGGLAAGGPCDSGILPLTAASGRQSSACSPRDTHMAQSTGCGREQLLLPTHQTAWLRLTRHVLLMLSHPSARGPSRAWVMVHKLQADQGGIVLMVISTYLSRYAVLGTSCRTYGLPKAQPLCSCSPTRQWHVDSIDLVRGCHS